MKLNSAVTWISIIVGLLGSFGSGYMLYINNSNTSIDVTPMPLKNDVKENVENSIGLGDNIIIHNDLPEKNNSTNYI